jgi:hypothetical protein
MPRFCASCGSLVAEGALACASCGATVGQSVGGGAAPATATTGLTESLAGALAYVTFLPALFFLVFEPYNTERPRRRLRKCTGRSGSARMDSCFALTLLSSAVFWASLLILPLGLVGIGLWIVLILKAYQGRIFKVPVIGDLAEKRANNA